MTTGLLHTSKKAKKKSSDDSTHSPSSLAPMSIAPSPESLQTITELQKRIQELEAKDQTNGTEIDRLKKELERLSTPAAPVTTNEREQPQSFFGV